MVEIWRRCARERASEEEKREVIGRHHLGAINFGRPPSQVCWGLGFWQEQAVAEGRQREDSLSRSNYEVWSESQSRISVVWSRVGTGKHGCHIARGLAFLRKLPRGHDSQKGSSVTQRVSISLQGLRPVTRSARPGSSAGLQRHACVTTHGFP